MSNVFWSYFALGYTIGFIIASPAFIYAICLLVAS